MLTLVSLAPLLLAPLLSGCDPDPWEAFPTERMPDTQCRTGGDGGYDVYVFRCDGDDDERVVIHQFCTGLMGCSAAERVTGPCGEPTSFERELGDECAQMPDARRWPGS